ncbi:MAG: hypothetical protein KBT11_05430 [Treponema sp.]|nr:hypothetical protein [Candidatus Treponema equifaecale]
MKSFSKFFYIFIFLIFNFMLTELHAESWPADDLFNSCKIVTYSIDNYIESQNPSDQKSMISSITNFEGSITKFNESSEGKQLRQTNRDLRVCIDRIHAISKNVAQSQTCSKTDYEFIRREAITLQTFRSKTLEQAFSEINKNKKNLKILLLIIIGVVASTILTVIFFKIRIHNSSKFTKKILETQEQERIKIARELHDTVAQQLKSLQFEADASKNPKLAEISGESIKQIRAICYNLMPPDFNLVDSKDRFIHSIGFMCDQFTQKTGIKCSFVADENLEINAEPETLLNLFRIIQEALTNIENHSQAQKSSVILRRGKENSLIIIISDDGIGIDKTVLSGKENHFGLKSMRTRAEFIGASFNITSEKDDGTKIRIEL